MSTLTVGPGQEYATIASAVAASQSGDTIAVQAGTYVNDFSTIDHPLTLEGVGGMVTLDATAQPPNGKAIITTNADVTIDNFAFTGATVPDGNGAGIRYQAGNLVLNNDYFYGNQEGLLAAANPAGSITIDNTEFSDNGTGDGQTHNLYVGEVGTLTVENSLFTDAVVGHEIKSRADNTIIENNRIIDGPTGTASYSIDVPDGGHVLIENNVIEQGPLSQNPAIIHMGDDGTLYANTSLTISGNTVLNNDKSPSSSLLLNQTSISANITGNEIWGLAASHISSGPSTQSGNTFLASEPALDLAPPYVESAPQLSAPAQAVLTQIAGLPQPGLSDLTVETATAIRQTLTGTGHDTMLIGTATGDILDAGSGFTVLTAGATQEALYGGSGTDDFLGGSGGERMIAGTGASFMQLGSGADTIVLRTYAAGNVDVYGFDPKHDIIELHSTKATPASLIAAATNDGHGDAVLHYGSSEMVLHDILPSQVQASWFVIGH